MPSVTDQPNEAESSEAKFASKGYSILSPTDENNEGNGSRQSGERNNLELMEVHNSHESFDEGLILEYLNVLSLRWHLECGKSLHFMGSWFSIF